MAETPCKGKSVLKNKRFCSYRASSVFAHIMGEAIQVNPLHYKYKKNKDKRFFTQEGIQIILVNIIVPRGTKVSKASINKAVRK